MTPEAKALWVALKLRGEADDWRECVVCGAPTKHRIACQLSDPSSLMRPQDSPSGRDCWTTEDLFHDHQKLVRLMEARVERARTQKGARDV